MHSIIRYSAGIAGVLLAGAALAAGPVNPPPASCAIDEVYKCEKIAGQTYCKCAKRALTAAPKRNDDPRRLKGKSQHLANHGAGATEQTPDKPQDLAREGTSASSPLVARRNLT